MSVNRCTECGFAKINRAHYDNGHSYCDHPEVNKGNPKWLAGGSGESLETAREPYKEVPRQYGRHWKLTPLRIPNPCGLEGKLFVDKRVMDLCDPNKDEKARTVVASPVMTAPYQGGSQLGSGVLGGIGGAMIGAAQMGHGTVRPDTFLNVLRGIEAAKGGE